MTDRDREYVLVTEYFHPETAATGQLLTDLAVGLKERGLDVSVYTGQPNYHGKEHGREPSTSVYEGVPVHRIRAPQLQQSSTLRRGFNWVVFSIWMFVRLLLSSPDGERELLVVSNPPSLPPVVWLVCRIHGWEYTYIVHDIYPDIASAAGYFAEGGLCYRLWTVIQRQSLGDSRRVVALGPAMRERLLRLGGDQLAPEQVEIVHNWADETVLQPREKANNWFAKREDLVDTFTVLYSGNIGINHDLETAVRAAARLKDDPVTFLIIGDGDRKEQVRALAERTGVAEGTVRFLPYQDRKDLPYTLTAGDVSLVTVSEGMKGLCVSSKLYTSLAAGTPILVIAEPGDDEATVVEQHDAGIHVTQGDVAGVVDAVTGWMENPVLVEQQGKNARTALENNYTKARAIDEYYELLTGSPP
jgi:glycosyltransferase involved in cell wall biosynthesis